VSDPETPKLQIIVRVYSFRNAEFVKKLVNEEIYSVEVVVSCTVFKNVQEQLGERRDTLGFGVVHLMYIHFRRERSNQLLLSVVVSLEQHRPDFNS